MVWCAGWDAGYRAPPHPQPQKGHEVVGSKSVSMQHHHAPLSPHAHLVHNFHDLPQDVGQSTQVAAYLVAGGEDPLVAAIVEPMAGGVKEPLVASVDVEGSLVAGNW